MTEPEGRALLIKKLLNKAEAKGTTEAERESLNAKALELMLKWGIEDAMLTDVDRLSEERIIRSEFTTDVPQSYSFEYAKIGIQIAEALNCRGLLQAREHGRGKRTNLLVVGFESDVQRVGQLFQSLALQCTIELSVWYARAVREWMSGTDKYNAKRSFVTGYANGVKEKFTAAKRNVMVDATPGTDLVLVDRRAKVDDWMRDNMRARLARPRRYDSGAAGFGYSAGQRADLGGGKLGGERRRIGG